MSSKLFCAVTLPNGEKRAISLLLLFYFAWDPGITFSWFMFAIIWLLLRIEESLICGGWFLEFDCWFKRFFIVAAFFCTFMLTNMGSSRLWTFVPRFLLVLFNLYYRDLMSLFNSLTPFTDSLLHCEFSETPSSPLASVLPVPCSSGFLTIWEIISAESIYFSVICSFSYMLKRGYKAVLCETSVLLTCFWE